MKRGYVVISGPLNDDGSFNIDDITFTFGDMVSTKEVLKLALKVVKHNAEAEGLESKDVATSGCNSGESKKKRNGRK